MSPLDIAKKNMDLQVLQDLVGYLIDVQGCFESSHLVDNILVGCIEKDLDLKRLFDSKICTMLVQRDTFKQFSHFPEFHPSAKTMSSPFRGNWVELQNSKTVVEDVFGEKYGVQSIRDGNDEDGSLLNHEGTQPIWYTIDALFMSCSEEQRIKQAQNLVKALATTNNLQVFQTSFIQRFVNQ